MRLKIDQKMNKIEQCVIEFIISKTNVFRVTKSISCQLTIRKKLMPKIESH